MPQSLAIGEGFYELSHDGLRRVWGGRKWPARVSVIAWDLVATFFLPLPGSDGWVHEEYHRAVMGRRRIDSFNDVYKFDTGGDAIYVSHVKDEDLVRLKRDHPAEQVRMSAAGIEGEYQLIEALEKNAFFRQSNGWHLPLYWAIKFGSFAYVLSGTFDAVNSGTDTLNVEDGPDISVRDFTGHDFTAWVYDLHRPDEPYAARGVHPTGVGIDRYIKPEDLTSGELRYLRRQGWLQLLNFVDPFLLDARGITVSNPVNGRPMRLNARAGHVLTPFGYTIDADVLLHQEEVRLFVVLHTYVNERRALPGIEVTMMEYPINAFRQALAVSPRAAIWLQPAGQRFHTGAVTPGGAIGIRVRKREAGHIGAFVEMEGKTAGWIAGNVYLGPNVSVRAAVTLTVR